MGEGTLFGSLEGPDRRPLEAAPADAPLADRMRPYLWWDEAKAAGVDLPASKHVWHYNPIAFLDALLADPTPTSVADSPAEDDPGEDDAGSD
jgi:hypothetical protein